MKHAFYENIYAILEEKSETIIFIAIVALLVFAYIKSYRKNKRRYDKMMSSVMAVPENEYMTGGMNNTCVWNNSIDAATVNEYRKDYARLKLHNLWGIIKRFIIIFGIAFGFLLIGCMQKGTLDLFRVYVEKMFMPVVMLFLVDVCIYLKAPSSAMISDDSILYRRLVPKMVRSLFGADTVYSHTRAMDNTKLRKLNFYEHRPEEIKGRDYISGVYKGVRFECGYENAEYTEKDGEGDKYTYSTFHGIMLMIPYRKTSDSMIGLRGRTEQEIKDRKGMRTFGNRIDKTENDKFNRLFFIMSQDEKNLYYMLTPDILEKLIVLYENFGGFSERLHVCFDEDVLYIGIPLEKNYLMYKSVAPSAGALKKVQEKMWNDLNVVRAVLDLVLTF